MVVAPRIRFLQRNKSQNNETKEEPSPDEDEETDKPKKVKGKNKLTRKPDAKPANFEAFDNNEDDDDFLFRVKKADMSEEEEASDGEFEVSHRFGANSMPSNCARFL